MRLRLRCIILAVLALSWVNPADGYNDDASAQAELNRKREMVDDFYKRREARADELRERNFGAEAVSRRRAVEDERRDRVRETYVRFRVRKSTEQIEREDRRDEIRLERERARREKLAAGFVRRRDRFLRVLDQGRKINEDVEYGLEHRDRDRNKPIRETEQTTLEKSR